MDRGQYERALEQLQALNQQGRVGDALSLVEELLEEYPAAAELHGFRGILMQVCDEDPGRVRTLEMVRESFATARVLAPRSPEPLIELGHFEYAVEDNAAGALEHFDKALALAEASVQEAMVGQAKCYNDLGETSRAREILRRLKVLFPGDEEMRIFDLEMEEFFQDEP